MDQESGLCQEGPGMRRIALMVLALIVSPGLIWSWSAVGAQQETPTVAAGKASSAYLPDVAVFGKGWEETDRAGLDVPSDIFREGSYAVYGGPAGARIVVLAYLATDSRVAVRQSWETATEQFDRSRYTLASNYDYEQAERLEALEPPAGCVEAKRAEGSDDQFGFTAGLTMCAVDPDAIVIAMASGEVGGESGYAASDAVIGESLKAAS